MSQEYKDKLSGFADRLKTTKAETPIQEVRPVNQKTNEKKQKIVRTTIHLPQEIHTRIKLHCVQSGISFKEFVTEKLIGSLQNI